MRPLTGAGAGDGDEGDGRREQQRVRLHLGAEAEVEGGQHCPPLPPDAAATLLISELQSITLGLSG